MIVFKQVGDFKPTYKFLKNVLHMDMTGVFDRYGRLGVELLSTATPVDTGTTAASWDYKVDILNGKVTITWTNNNAHDGINVALLLQYGHATKNGGWVEGRDYINPAIQPLFDEMAEKVWKEVTAK